MQVRSTPFSPDDLLYLRAANEMGPLLDGVGEAIVQPLRGHITVYCIQTNKHQAPCPEPTSCQGVFHHPMTRRMDVTVQTNCQNQTLTLSQELYYDFVRLHCTQIRIVKSTLIQAPPSVGSDVSTRFIVSASRHLRFRF